MSGNFAVRAARVLLPEAERAACVVVADGRIVEVRDFDTAPPGLPVETLAADLVLMPGLVDVHVHANEPGRTDWEGFAHATRAAAAGGVTTIVDMPLNAIPATTTEDGLRAKLATMPGALHVDVGLWGGAVPGNAAAMVRLAERGVLGFKAFRAPSGVPEFEAVDGPALGAALAAAAPTGRALLLHAEAPDHLHAPTGDPRRYATWLESRPAAAEAAAVAELAALAARFGARVHVVHVASAAAVAAVCAARAAGVRISAETCPHYLTFAAGDIPDGATAFKCAPPIRGAAEREALWNAIATGALDMVASDHSPAPPALKLCDGDFLRAWGGVASLELLLRATWTGARARGHALHRLAGWLAAAPAALAGVAGRKGGIVPGADADLVAFAPDASAPVVATRLQHRHPLTPYDGRVLAGAVRTTWLAGERAWDAALGFAAPGGRWLRAGPGTIDRVDPARGIA